MTNKAYGFDRFGGPEVQDWFELPDPTPGAREVLVRVKAAGVNPVDWKIRNGDMADPNGESSFPQVLGVEAAGVVEAVGADVDHLAVGDEVFGRAAQTHGTYAELAVLDATGTAKKPAQLDFDAAASIPVSGVTAWTAVEQLDPSEGQSVLVTGAAGSVGVQVLQLLRDRGVAVFGVASESKRAMVESLGAILVPYDGGTDVVAQMRELLPGGVDGILDLVGPAALRPVAELVGDPQKILSIADFGVAEIGGALVTHDRPLSTWDTVARLMVEDKLDPKITSRYPFGEAEAALKAVESGHQLGKVVIDLTATDRV